MPKQTAMDEYGNHEEEDYSRHEPQHHVFRIVIKIVSKKFSSYDLGHSERLAFDTPWQVVAL